MRLFAYVASVMVLLMLAERAADPQVWRWLGQRAERQQPMKSESLAGEVTAARQQPEPFDPVRRAWDEAWGNAFERLSAEQQSLLFELLHAATRQQTLPLAKQAIAAQLIGRLDQFWDAHQSLAFQSLADLKGDDQARWIEVLRQINDRFAKDVRPALETLSEGRNLNNVERSSMQKLLVTLVALTTSKIEDDTVFRPAEREIWFHLLARVCETDPAALRREAIGVTYLQLAEQPAAYRGRAVMITGTAKLAYRVQAPPNYLGINEYFVFWIHPSSGPNSPIVVYSLAAPPGFPAIKDKDLDFATTPLREEMTVTGVFFKRWAYAGQGGTFTAPLVLALVPQWQRAEPAQDAAAQQPVFGPTELGVMIAATLLLAVVSTLVLWRLPGRRRENAASGPTPANLAALANLEVGASAHEAIQALERQARDDGNASC